MNTNSEIRTKAREALTNNWWNAIAAFLIVFALTAVVAGIPGVGQIAILLGEGALSYGLLLYFLELVRKNEIDLNLLFKGFNFDGTNLGLYGKTLGCFLLMNLYVFLWSLLLIIPGIIAAYSYRMVFFILIDNPEMSVVEILRKSKAMMYGYKGKLFLLDLSFIGWAILSILTFGIGFIWLYPYMTASLTVFYEQLKGEKVIEKHNHDNNVSGVVQD
ncbi:MAG: DUF975 family protein [Candidatus Cloacimonetes bacterium]|nr:DUF975 family protein [Candidatus Cloacimonadota bacterium]